MLDLTNVFSFPRKHILSSCLNYLLNNGCFIFLKEKLNVPFSKLNLKSDITNVVYYNWMIPIEKVKHLIPKGFELEEYNGLVPLTILNYKHGNFRPSFFNGVKWLFSSPIQGNWRLYLNSNSLDEKKSSVLFISNIISNVFYAIGSRVFSNILQTHYPLGFQHFQKGIELYTTIKKGYSNSPSLDAIATINNEWKIPNEFAKIATNRKELLKKISLQDFAITKLGERKFCQTEINLNFKIDDVKPLSIVKLESNVLKSVNSNSNCFAFVIPKLILNTVNEKIY